MKKLKVGNRIIEVSNPDKIIFPKSKISKLEFVEYYRRIAPFMLPFLKNRPISMQRFPDGIASDGFYQKDASPYFPSWIKRVEVPKANGGKVHYVICNNAETLVYLASQLVITPHLWLSSLPKLDCPDRMIFDLDPSPGVNFTQIRWAAKELKAMLDELGIPVFIMTTGSRGVHLVIPLKRIHTYDFVRSFAHDLAELLVHEYPKKLTLAMSKAKRGKRIFVDYLRNGFGATGAAPFSVRAHEGAPVATPFDWSELAAITPQKYTIKTIFRRLKTKKDPWANIAKKACSLKAARNKLDVMRKNAGLP
jgi:bifunctional non-homologous end joining protein LigD